MLADVQLQLGKPAAAAATLAPWLPAARRGERLGGALLAGPHVLARLAAADWHGLLADGDGALFGRLAARLAEAQARWRVEARLPGSLDGAGTGAPATGGRPVAAHRVAEPPAGRDADQLTEREREVLARIAAGDSNKLIARAFELSPHTVKRHVANILGKLGVDTRGQAAARWHAG